MPELSRLLDLGFQRRSVAPVEAEALQVDAKTFQLTTTWPAMGTLVSVSVLGRSRARLEEGVGRSFEEMDRLIGLLSRFEHASAVAALNQAGRLDAPPLELSGLVARALTYYEITGGAFDISVEPLVNLFRERLTGAVPAPPSEVELREAAALVGARDIAVSRRAIRFGKPGMGVTLDGIAKGFIVDAMASTLDRAGVRDYLINAGGDIRTAGVNQGREPWTVAVRDPWDPAGFAGTVRLSGRAVATSGSYEIYFDPDRRFHHIVDARTGRSPGHCASATVIAPTTTAADALATSLIIMAPIEGARLIESMAGCSCLIIAQDGRRFASRGWSGTAPRIRAAEE